MKNSANLGMNVHRRHRGNYAIVLRCARRGLYLWMNLCGIKDRGDFFIGVKLVQRSAFPNQPDRGCAFLRKS
jgi:hypothetical protein